MRTDSELLQAYVQRHDETAFREFVSRRGGLVHAAALRQVRDPSLAEEVAQNVFCLAARKAPTLMKHPALAAWLHRATRLESLHALRAERRRRVRELTVDHRHPPSSPIAPEPAWSEVQPWLDEALDRLKETDRQALLLRFFQEQSFREVGAGLGLSEDAAKMRVSRALEKLRKLLTRRGLMGTTAALAVVLTEQAPAMTLPAPASAAWSAQALSGAPGGAGGLASFLTLMFSTKLTTALAAAALLLPPAWSWHDTRSHAATAIPNGLDAVLPPAPPPRPLFNPNRVALSVDRDPRLAALAEASRQPDALEEDYPRMLDLTQIVFQLEPAQFPDALAILLKMKPSAPAKSLIRVLFSHWAEQDPAAAFAAAPAKGLLREEALSGVLSVWMRQAPDAALAHVSSQLSGEAQEETLLLAFQQLSSLDPRATLERWPAIPDPQVATKVKTTALSLWANRDAPAALAWVRAFDDETSRDTSERTIIDALSATDPVQAVALAQTMANPRNRDRALRTSLSTLAQHDPAAARQALLSLPPELLHSPELFSAMLQMTYWDPAGMTTILEHLPLAKRDELGMQLAMSWLRLDVRTASAWIHQTTDLSEKSKAALLPLTKP